MELSVSQFEKLEVKTSSCASEIHDGVLTVRARPICDYALKGVVNKMQVMIELISGTSESDKSAKKRPPFDLSIVLDKSGSMSGNKLEHSKLAIQQVIENLDSDDRLHFVIYDTQVETVFENGDLKNRSALIQKVNNISVGSCTNLSGGLERGAEILKRHKKEGRTQRIFLFSDGLANEGLKTHPEIFALVEKIHKEGPSVNSFGIGDDFDEELMKGMAEYGSGHYFFIGSADVIPKYVEQGLKGLLKLVGSDAILKIRGKNNATVKKIYDHDDVIAGAKLRDIRENNVRQLIAEIEVTPDFQKKEDEIITFELSFIPPGQQTAKSISANLKILFTEDDSLLKQKTPEVLVAWKALQAGEIDKEVVALLDANKIEEAIKRKEEAVELLKEVEKFDQTGFITPTRERAEKNLQDMKSRKDTSKVRKNMHWHGYLNRRLSTDAMDMMSWPDHDL